MQATQSVTDLDVPALLIGLLGGLSLFLLGMDRMTDSMKAVAGDSLRRVLERLTKNRVSAAVTGATVTAIVQSSSVTTVLVVGFITAGLMSLMQSVGVIMGANIGTTITAQIIAFKVTKYALLLVALGFGTAFVTRRERVKQIGWLVMGLGLVFFGMALMSEATKPLRSFQPFLDLMVKMDNPLLAILVAAVFTALVQSSSATTGIVIVLASQGFISLNAGIALALGANIGTCATAILASIGKPRIALQAAAVHVAFNVTGVLLWVAFIPQLAEFVKAVSPTKPALEGVARLAAETPRQVANAHTVFNIVNTMLLLPFAGVLAALIQRLLPERPQPKSARAQPRYLDAVYLDTPALALSRLRLEFGHLGELVESGMSSLSAEQEVQRLETGQFAATAADFENVYGHMLEYARDLRSRKMSSEESAALERVLLSANHLLSIVDTLGQHLITLLEEWKARSVSASPETAQRMLELARAVRGSIGRSVQALRENDVKLAAAVVSEKAVIGARADELMHRLGERLVADAPRRLETYRLEASAVEVLRRLYYFAKRIAKNVLHETDDVELAEG